MIQKKEKDHNAQKYSLFLYLNRIYLSVPEEDTKILWEEMERIGGRQRSGSEWEEKGVECIEERKGIKPREIFNEEKRTNEGLLMLQTLFYPQTRARELDRELRRNKCVLILYCVCRSVCVLTHVSLGIIRANYMERERQMLPLAYVTVENPYTTAACCTDSS